MMSLAPPLVDVYYLHLLPFGGGTNPALLYAILTLVRAPRCRCLRMCSLGAGASHHHNERHLRTRVYWVLILKATSNRGSSLLWLFPSDPLLSLPEVVAVPVSEHVHPLPSICSLPFATSEASSVCSSHLPCGRPSATLQNVWICWIALQIGCGHAAPLALNLSMLFHAYSRRLASGQASPKIRSDNRAVFLVRAHAARTYVDGIRFDVLLKSLLPLHAGIYRHLLCVAAPTTGHSVIC